MSLALLAALVAGSGIYLAVTALPWGAPRPTLDEQLRRFDLDVQLAKRPPRSGPRPLLPWPGLDAALRPFLEDLARPLRRLLGGADGTPSGLAADLAVLRPGMTPAGFVASQLLWAGLAGGVGFGLVLAGGRASPTGLAAAGLLGLLGFLWPLLRLRAASRARRGRIVAELPQIAQLLSSTVSAGLVPDAALERVARRSAGVLGLELRRVSQQVSEGHRSMVDALAELAARERVPELGRLVALLRAADEQGLPVVQPLLVMATSLLEQQATRLVEAGEKGTVRMVVPLGLVMVPVVLLVVAVPTWDALRGLLGS